MAKSDPAIYWQYRYYEGQNEIGLDGYLSFVDNNWERIKTLSLEKIEPI